MTKPNEDHTSSRNAALTAFIVGVVASIIASAIFVGLQLIPLSWAFVASLGVVIIAETYIIFWRLRNSSLQSDLPVIGITAVTKNKNVPLEQIVELASHSIYFWGISGKRTISNPAFRDAILRVARGGGDIRFLLSSPKSTVLRARADEEKESVNAWISDIEGTAERFRQLARREGVPLHIRFSDDYPIWRMLIIDRRYLYVHWFLPGKQGPESPEVLIHYTVDGLGHPLLRSFEETWKRCEKYG